MPDEAFLHNIKEIDEKILLHIGPPKTGTSAVQGACHAARPNLLLQGVRYAGRSQQVGRAAYAAVGRVHPSLGRVPSTRYWRELVAEVESATERKVVISSEFFAGANLAQISRIVAELGGDQVHIVITLRPIAKILASRWQQNIQEGATYSYEEWLRLIFEHPTEKKGIAFWSRQRHEELVKRWADVVGPGRITIVIPDDSDRKSIFRYFEQLIGVQKGTLTPQSDTSNRSLTLEESEFLRALNGHFNAEGLSRALHYKLVTRGIAMQLKGEEPNPLDVRIDTPEWATQRANRVGLESVRAIRELQIQVVGNLDTLVDDREPHQVVDSNPPQRKREDSTADSRHRIAVETAAQGVMGILSAVGLLRGSLGSNHRIDLGAEPLQIQRMHTYDLIRVVAQRVYWRLASRVRALLRMKQ